jgi:HPt (histidine-containing phosphotransfer) domain-containing protein
VSLTAHALKGELERFLVAGLDAYVAQPMRASDIRAIVGALVKEEGGRTRADEPDGPEWSHGAPYFLRPFEHCGQDEEITRELIASFSESSARSVEALQDAIERSGFIRLASEAHGLEGASLMVRACKLAESCVALEKRRHRGDVVVAWRDVGVAQAIPAGLRDSLS